MLKYTELRIQTLKPTHQIYLLQEIKKNKTYLKSRKLLLAYFKCVKENVAL